MGKELNFLLKLSSVSGLKVESVYSIRRGGSVLDLKLCRRLRGGAKGEIWVCVCGLLYFSVWGKLLKLPKWYGLLGPSSLPFFWDGYSKALGFRVKVCLSTPSSFFTLVLACPHVHRVVDSANLNCSGLLQTFPVNEPENTRQVVNNCFNECAKHATGCMELSG